MESSQDTTKEREQHAKPPLFSSWSPFYWIVIGNLALLILLFYIFDRIYS